MTQFKKGDRVRFAYRLNGSDTGTVVGFGPGSYVVVKHDRFTYTWGCDVTGKNPGAGTFPSDTLTLIERKPEPKFKVGDRVRVTDSLPYGFDTQRRIAPGDVVTVIEHGACYPYRVETRSGSVHWLQQHEVEKIDSEFKLEPGDKVKNLKTGRVGVTYYSSVIKCLAVNEPANSPSYKGAAGLVPAAALEAWEAEHPGTYDLVFEEKAPW